MLTILVLGFLVCTSQFAGAEPMGTAFTYQGQLYDASYPANGKYDLAFKLYDASTGGSKMGTDVNAADVNVIDGYFTVELDFGSSVFDSNNRWLEIGVRQGYQNDPCAYISLSPRQKMTVTPYAIYAESSNWNKLLNVPAGFADGNDDVGGGDNLGTHTVFNKTSRTADTSGQWFDHVYLNIPVMPGDYIHYIWSGKITTGGIRFYVKDTVYDQTVNNTETTNVFKQGASNQMTTNETIKVAIQWASRISGGPAEANCDDTFFVIWVSPEKGTEYSP